MTATTPEQMLVWTEPVILNFGFRPIFLLAGSWASLAIVLWIVTPSGHQHFRSFLASDNRAD